MSKSSSTSLAIALSVMLAGAVLLQPSTLGAQDAPSGVQSAAPATPVGPVAIPSATYRPMVVELPGETKNAALVQSADRNNVAWMAVGVAGLMVGLLIGGDAGTIIAVTGGVIGLMGLFRYLN